MTDQLKTNHEAIAALLGQSQAVTDHSGVSTPPGPGAVDGLPDPRPSKAIPTLAIADGHQPRDDTHPGWNHCGDAVVGARDFEAANEGVVSNPSIISPSFRDHLRAVYPPDLPEEPSWMDQEKWEYGRASSNGIDVRLLVNENRKKVRAYLEDASKEQESRQELFNRLDELEEKMVCVQQDTRNLGPNRSKGQIPPGVLDKINALRLEESALNKEHSRLLKLLWVRHTEVQGTISRILESRTLDFETKDDANGGEPITIAHPSCALKDPDTGGAESTSKEAQGLGKSIPDWFCLLEKKGWVRLRSQGEENRFDELLNKLARLEDEVRRQQTEVQGTRKAPWDDHFHEPNPGWAHESQRIRGGWWTCRDGEDAPLAERLCQVCRSESPESSPCGSPVAQVPDRRAPKSHPPTRIPQRKPQQRHNPKVMAADYLEELMGRVRTAMAIVAEKDKKFVTAMMQLERLDASHQLRGDERGRFPAPSE